MRQRITAADCLTATPEVLLWGAGRAKSSAMLDPRTQVAPPRKVTAFQLVFMTYAVLCSGAYGLEEMISVSGPGVALLTLLLLPLLWAVPIGLVCAELSASYPIEGGYYRWARLAFGDFVGYQTGWLVWLGSFVTNATFAVLFANYLHFFFPALPHLSSWAVSVGVVWATVYLNWRGIRPVGMTSVIFSVLIILPFAALTALGLARWQFNPLSPLTSPDKGPLAAFSASLGMAIWLYSGLEKLTPNAGEVENPERAFPLAMAITVLLAAASYILPTAAALAGHGHWQQWGESYFAVAAQALGGPFLGAAMAVGGLLSSVSLLMVTTLGQSRLPMVMAEDGLFPTLFSRTHPRYGSPTVSLLFGGLLLSALVWQKFSYLVAMFSLVQVLAYLLIFAALLKLRMREPEAASSPRSRTGFRIPLSTAGLLLLAVPCLALSTLVIAQTIWHDGKFDTRQAVVDALVLASGPLSYLLLSARRRRNHSPRV